MSLNSDIRGIIGTVAPDATFVLSSWFKANVASYELDEISTDKPFIIHSNEEIKDNEIQLNSNILANTQIKIWFLFKAGVYASDSEMEADFDLIELLVNQVAVNIYQLTGVRLKGSELGKYRMIKRFKIFNSVLAGWELTASFKYNVIANWCQYSGVTADSSTVTADSNIVTASG